MNETPAIQPTPIDASIFKSYDVRGVYPSTLNEMVAEKIGAATAEYLHAKKLGVGRDMRESSSPLAQAIIRGITSRGCDVVEFGLISTDMLYFGVGSLELDGGIMITASHNPGKDNGLKFCGKNAFPIALGTGLEKIRDIALQGNISSTPSKGNIQMFDLMPSYREK